MVDLDKPVPCAVCGTPGGVSQRFCTVCGTMRAVPDAAPETVRGPTLSPAPAVCGTCGAPYGGKRFCQTCGTPVAETPAGAATADDTVRKIPARPVSPPPPYTPPYAAAPRQPTPVPLPVTSPPASPPSPPSEGARRRSGLLLALVMVLLVAVVGGGAFLLVRNAGGDDTAADPVVAEPSGDQSPDAPGDSTGPIGGPTTGAGESPSQSPAQSPSQSQTPSQSPKPEPVLVECWRGPDRPSVADCPPLTGYRAVQWIFAGVDVDGCRRQSKPARIYLQCRDGDGDLMYNLSLWSSFEAGAGHYARTPGGSSSPITGDRLRWDGVSASDDKSAFMYRGLPWGVTVYGDTAAERDARAAAVHMRLIETVRSYS